MVNNVKRRKKRTKISQIIIYIVLFLLGAVCLYPLLNVLARSFSSASAIDANPAMIIPQSFTLEAYKYLFNTPALLKSFMITVVVTLAGTFLAMCLTVTCAYAISRVHVPGYKLMMWIVIIPMLFGAGLIPTYVTLSRLNLLNTIWVLILVGAFSPMNAILMRNFFWSLPESLEESARLEGAGELRILGKIILPLSKPVMATIGLFYAVGYWNDYFKGLFYVTDNSKWPLQVLMKSIVLDTNMQGMGTMGSIENATKVVQTQNIQTACIIFSIIPILCVYPFLQKYFVSGLIVGAVKG